jgi:hypothetical protein
MSAVVPIRDLGQRMAEHGRIRLGVKSTSRNGKVVPKSIDTFRFTSPDRAAIEQLAELYGGTARPWSDPKASPTNQFEVVTTTSEIPVMILPGGLSQSYEMWTGGGCVRRCDGVECETSQQTYDADYEPVIVQCICSGKGVLECALHTRVQVVIPTIRFGGAWRLDTKGRNAAEEIPAMADMIEQLQVHGILRAFMALERRQSQGGRRSFVVPTFRIDVTPDELASGQATTALTTGVQDAVPAAAPALGRGDGPPAAVPSAPPWDVDSEVAEAELVEDGPGPRLNVCRWCGHPMGPGLHEWVDVPNSSDAGDYCASCPDSACIGETVYQLENAPRDPVELTERQVQGLLAGTAKWSAHTEGRVVKA